MDLGEQVGHFTAGTAWYMDLRCVPSCISVDLAGKPPLAPGRNCRSGGKVSLSILDAGAGFPADQLIGWITEELDGWVTGLADE